MYKWFLAWRYLYTKLIAYFGIASVTLCVAMVLVVMSVMGGFLDTVRARSRGLLSDIVVDAGSIQGFPYYAEFEAHLRRELPNLIRTSTPSIYTYGIFRIPATSLTKMTRIIGIRFDDYMKINDFAKGLNYNRFFPGTTTLGEQELAVVGLAADGTFHLPPDLEAASARWRGAETDPQALAQFDAFPFSEAREPYITALIPGDRVFRTAEGPPTHVGPARHGIIVGGDIIHDRRTTGGFDRYLARGAEIALTVMPLTARGNLTGENATVIPLRYADDSHTGIFEIDSQTVYVDFDMLQSRLAMTPQPSVDGGMSPARATQLLIALQPGSDLLAAKHAIKEEWHRFTESLVPGLNETDATSLGRVDVLTWEDIQRDFIAAVEKEKVLVTILFGFISLVSIVLVGCILYMIVEKKIRDIGILKSVGASSRGVGGLFVVYASAVGVAGAICGTVLGTVFVWYINEFQDWLASFNPQLRVWTADVYSFDRIPNIVKPWDAVGIGCIAVLASIVGSVIPAVVAARVWPVRALRYE